MGERARLPARLPVAAPSVDPGELERDQGEHEVFRTLDKAALVGIHETGGDSGVVVGFEQFVLLGSPFVTVPGPLCHQTRHQAAGDPARGLDQHLEVVPVLVTPHDLANVVTGQGSEGLAGLGGSGRFHGIWVGWSAGDGGNREVFANECRRIARGNSEGKRPPCPTSTSKTRKRTLSFGGSGAFQIWAG